MITFKHARNKAAIGAAGIYCFLIVEVIVLLMTPADAEKTDMKFNEEMVSWKLYRRNLEKGLEFYYDTKNMMYLSQGSVIVTVKTVYKSEKAINELKKARSNNPLIKKNLKYVNLAYSIGTLEVYCAQREIAASEIMYDLDLDRKGNILNYVPNIPESHPIMPGSNGEYLYKTVCSRKKE